MSARLALVVAVAENGVIGASGDMPWHLSSDLKRFKALTMGKPILMGRKTFESIGKPLPGRTNIVVTRAEDFAPPGVVVARSIEAALANAERVAEADGVDEIMIIGGATIYQATIDRADRLYVTHVHAAPNGDTWFPPIDPAVWEKIEEMAVEQGPKDSAATSFAVYQRIG